MSRHQKICQRDSSKNLTAIPVTLINPLDDVHVTDDFKLNILSKFRADEVGKLCQTDPTIVTVGLRLYDKMKRKLDKVTEVRKSVRTDMRRLGHLYQEFKSQPDIREVNRNAFDLLDRTNFNQLCDAINNYTTDEDEKIKSGLKISLIYLIKTTALIMKGAILSRSSADSIEESSKQAMSAVTEIDLFLSVFNYMKDFVFSDATYQLNKQRQVKLRIPSSLPAESDIKNLKEYVVEKMAEFTGDEQIDTHSYVKLRDATCTRLTLFNGRRGGEVSLIVRILTVRECMYIV